MEGLYKKLSFDRDVMWTSCPSVAASRKVTFNPVDTALALPVYA
jgi:hypothetical protein